ncbi:hypothetical protein [Meiothermus sp.]|uniref:hypothetical protein n=1 Tax=Meiothermus sp. TaxID=1955249 RepID=UPI0035B53196
MDEWLISRLIASWRDQVWRNAIDRVVASQAERASLTQKVEKACLEIANSILFKR